MLILLTCPLLISQTAHGHTGLEHGIGTLVVSRIAGADGLELTEGFLKLSLRIQGFTNPIFSIGSELTLRILLEELTETLNAFFCTTAANHLQRRLILGIFRPRGRRGNGRS